MTPKPKEYPPLPSLLPLQVEDFLLKRHTCMYTRKCQPVYSFSLDGAPPPPWTPLPTPRGLGPELN